VYTFCFIHEYNYIHYTGGNDLIFGVLTPLSTICQLYHGDQFSWWKKPEYPERTTDYGQATGKPDHLRLRNVQAKKDTTF
jgi:hypothetical protein